MSQESNKVPPSNCRQQLAADGKPYPRSSCAVCGQFSPRWKECDALLAAAPVPPARGEAEVLAVVTLGGYFSAEELGDIDIEPRMAVLEQIQQEVVMTDADEHLELVDRAHVTRLLAENAALQQRLTVADEQVDILSGGLRLMTSFGSGTNIAGVKTVAKQTLNRAAGVVSKPDTATPQ